MRRAVGEPSVGEPPPVGARRRDKGKADKPSAPDLDHFRTLLHAHMVKKGLRSTDQRKIIVETFFKAPHHISIEELLMWCGALKNVSTMILRWSVERRPFFKAPH